MRTLAIVAALVATTIPAAAERAQAVVDGIRYRLPEGASFAVPMRPDRIRPADLQAAVDRNRDPATPGPKKLLFLANSKDGVRVLVAKFDPADPAALAQSQAEAKATMPEDGVVQVTPREDAAFKGKWYWVRTGVDFAPEARVTCADEAPRSRCNVRTVLDGKLVLNTWDVLDQSTHAGIRDGAAASIRSALPDGLRPQKRR